MQKNKIKIQKSEVICSNDETKHIMGLGFEHGSSNNECPAHYITL